jgi:hypothetical protein
MIEQVDERVKAWAVGVAGQVDVSMAPPAPGRQGTGVGLYLLGLQDRPPLRGQEGPLPLQIGLRYLVTTWSDTPERAHHLLGQLALAAMVDSEVEIEMEGLPVAAWAAFQLPPEPAFVLVAVLRQERPAPPSKLARQLHLRSSPMRQLAGTVVGPEDVPLAAASVELPALQLAAVTDWRGRFAFAAVPADPAVKHLVVRARGRVLAVDADLAATDPLTIRFTPLEG